MVRGFRSAPATEPDADSYCHEAELCPEPVLFFGKVHSRYCISCPFKEREKEYM